MIPRKFTNTHCKVHETSAISHICLHKDCVARSLCDHCLQSHDPEHQDMLKSVIELSKVDFQQEVDKLRNTINSHMIKAPKGFDSHLYSERLKAQIILAFDSIRDNMIESILKSRNAILNQLQEFMLKVSFNERKAKIEDPHVNWDLKMAQLDHLYFKYFEDIDQGDNKTNANELNQFARCYSDLMSAQEKSSSEDGVMNFTPILDKAQQMINTAQSQFKKLFTDYIIVQLEQEIMNTLPADRFTANLDINSLRKIGKIDLMGNCDLNSIECLPIQRLLLIGDTSGTLTVWKSENCEFYGSLQLVEKKPIISIKHSAKYGHVVAGVEKDLKVIEITSQNKPKLVKTLSGHSKAITGIYVWDSKDMVYSIGKDPNIKIWNLKTLKKEGEIDTLKKGDMGAGITVIGRSGLLAVSFYSGFIGLFNVDKKKQIASIQTKKDCWVHSLLYLNDRNVLAAGVGSNKIKFWKFNQAGGDPQSLAQVDLGITSGTDLVAALEPANDGNSILVINGQSHIQTVSCIDGTSSEAFELGIKRAVAAGFDPIKNRFFIGDASTGTVVILQLGKQKIKSPKKVPLAPSAEEMFLAEDKSDIDLGSLLKSSNSQVTTDGSTPQGTQALISAKGIGQDARTDEGDSKLPEEEKEYAKQQPTRVYDMENLLDTPNNSEMSDSSKIRAEAENITNSGAQQITSRSVANLGSGDAGILDKSSNSWKSQSCVASSSKNSIQEESKVDLNKMPALNDADRELSRANSKDETKGIIQADRAKMELGQETDEGNGGNFISKESIERMKKELENGTQKNYQ